MYRVLPGLRADRGSVLIIAVIGMLILGVLAVSFALLARIESTVGFNFKQQGQAEALAEAALDRARDTVRGAATANDGFTAWLNSMLWGGNQTPAAYSGNPGYWYRARVDNDCSALNTVPSSIEEPITCADATIRNSSDTNDTAVVTAWAAAGSGRSRVRAILSIDNAWRHVCSDHKADNGGLCNNDDNTNGNPSIQPADPNDPNGPAAWEDLPRPYMGCSRIDYTVHGATQAQCNAYPNMYTYPYPAGGGTPRWVVTGPTTAESATAVSCNPTGGHAYYGYFDCALATPCDPAATQCGGSATILKGCLAAEDPTDVSAANPYANARWVKVVKVAGVITNGCDAQLSSQAVSGTSTRGMVFKGNLPDLDWGGSVGGGSIVRFTYYVLSPGIASIQDHTVVGTVVVEGDGQPTSGTNYCSGSNHDAEARTRAKFYTGPTPASNPLSGTWGPQQYGYPLAFLIWDPLQAKEGTPLPTSTGAPQRTCADMGSAGGGSTDRAQIHGLVYSGGHVEFNPMSLDGGVIAWEIQTQATSSNYAYNYSYGNATPPAGFPKGGGTDIKIVRKSFIVCSNYSDDSGGASACQ